MSSRFATQAVAMAKTACLIRRSTVTFGYRRILALDSQFARLSVVHAGARARTRVRIAYSYTALPETTYGGRLLPWRGPQVVQELRAGCHARHQEGANCRSETSGIG